MIELKSMRAGYGSEEILHDLSFTFESGKNYCILGPNGCGKTTLLRAMAGLIPHKGEVLIDGQRVESMKRRKIASKIAVMSQINTLYFPYTIYDTVMLGRYQHINRFSAGASEEDRRVVDRCLEMTGLVGLQNRMVDELSGGQLQRVFLAQTLAQEPDTILLDEPTNHLDIRHQIDLIEYLKGWTADGRHSVIGVMHDINLALRLTDETVFLKDGRLAGAGRFQRVATKPFLNSIFDMDISAYMLDALEKWKTISDTSSSEKP
ncbi:MAG: ABC transporter ATP-binding protein [Clostridia bacterium]|nr:ABC transporter ATP-binding protein [Clostridia bacterium]